MNKMKVLIPLFAILLMGADDCMNMPATGKIGGVPGGYSSAEADNIHRGYDITPQTGDSTAVFAMGDGKIIQVASSGTGGHGKRIVLRTDDGYHVYYAHLAGFAVSNGDNVYRGQHIGWAGNTGTSVVHLHFEIWDVLWQRHLNAGRPERLQWSDGTPTPFRTAPNGERVRLINPHNETGIEYLGLVEGNSLFAFDRNPFD